MDDDDIFADYDPTPYEGGYKIDHEYGLSIPPSDETCYPISSTSSDDYRYGGEGYGSGGYGGGGYGSGGYGGGEYGSGGHGGEDYGSGEYGGGEYGSGGYGGGGGFGRDGSGYGEGQSPAGGYVFRRAEGEDGCAGSGFGDDSEETRHSYFR